MKKRTLSLLLALCMVLQLCSSMAFATELESDVTFPISGKCGMSLTWTLDADGTMTISGSGAMFEYSFDEDNEEIPYRETPWLELSEDIRKIVIEEGVTSIGSYAFSYLGNLNKVTIPSTVTAIGECAFGECYRISEITFKGDAPAIHEYAFNYAGYYDGTTAYYPEGNATWTEAVMQQYGGTLTWLALPMDDIEDGGEDNPGGDIGTEGEGGTAEPEQPEGITWSISDDGTILTIDGIGPMPDYEYIEIDYWGQYTTPWYAYASNITEVIIGDGITRIGANAFGEMWSLEKITIGASVAELAEGVFQSCYALGELALSADNRHFCLQDGVLFNAEQTELIFYPSSLKTATYAVPTTVEKIFPYAFYCASYNLTTVGFPIGLTEIGDHAFYYKSLTSITLPDTVTTIGDFAFYGNSASSLTIPDSVTSIGEYAFGNIFGLTDVYIGSGLQEMGECAFSDCSDLATIMVDAGNSAFCAEENILFTKNKDKLLLYPKTKTEPSYTVPDTVRTIAARAFYSNSGLTEVILPDGLETIGEDAFFNIRNLAKADLPDSVTVIGSYAFGNTALTAVTIPDGVETIGASAFAYAPVTTVTIGKGVTEIEERAFSGCTQLTEITFCGNAPTAVGQYAFSSVRATAYYPAGNDTWTEAVRQDYGGTLTWVPVGQAVEDTEAPVFNSQPGGFSVPAGTYGGTGLNASVSIAVGVKDNVGVASVKLEYANGGAYVLLTELTNAAAGTSFSTVYSWDVSMLTSGEYTIRATPYDTSGNAGEPETGTITVDNTPPAAPGDFTVTAGQMKNTLSWSRSTELGTTTKIYRALAEDGERSCIASIPEGSEIFNALVDTGVTADTAYYYWITAADELGNESTAVGSVRAVPLADTTAPEISSISPVNGSLLTGAVTFTVQATDNVQVQSIALACSADGQSWTNIGTVETAKQAQFVVQTTDYAGEKLYLQLTVRDISGNEKQDGTTYCYPVDNTPPEQVTGLTAAASSTTITLNWNDVPDQDFAYFVVEQLVGETWQQIKTVNNALGAYLTGLEPDTAYTYRVYAVDQCGNKGVPSESLTITTVPDTTAPVIAEISPAPGTYNAAIPMVFTVSDDQGVKSLSVQISYDSVSWTEVTVVGVLEVGTSVQVSYPLDTTTLQEGILSVRAVATDLSGNVGDSSSEAPFCQYSVDRTAPAVPTGLTAAAGNGTITLTWAQGGEADLNTYTVYRAAQEEGPYTVLASGLKQLYHVDRGLEYGATFYYRMDVTDRAGNRSETTATVACTVLQDANKPMVVSVSPSDGYTLGADTAIQVKVWDNNLVNTLYYQLSTDGGATWQAETAVSVAAAEKIVKLPVVQQGLEQDFQLKFWCVDAVGLESDAVYRSYGLDKTAPAAPAVTAAAQVDGLTVTLTWAGGSEDDLAGYRVYRAAQGGSYKLLTQKPGGESSYSYTDYTVEAATTYSYYIQAVDVRGNTANGAVSTCTTPAQADVEDTEAPVAVIEGSSVGATGYEIAFSAARSWDAVGVTAYRWDFGDGTTADTVQVNHAYQSAGSYTVTLTVWDQAGNKGEQTMTVIVRDPEAVGTLEITVRDESGQIVKNAGVYVDLGSEDMSVVYTDANGTARVRVHSGSHILGVYKEGYLPAKQTVEVAAGSTVRLTIHVVEREIVVGELTVERMTLEQIRDAGIDVSDPANQEVYEFNIKLTYGTYEYVLSGAYNGDGDVLRDPEPIEINEEDEIRKLVARVFPVGFGSGSGSGSGGGNGGSDDTEVPMVVVMDIPGTASWLKDFFDVRLTVINQADAEFVLDDCLAHLNVPTGLTLMETNRTSASPDYDMGSIAGQSSATAEWILRGDKAGYYDLTADFSAVLRDFNAAVNARFETDEPIQVRQGDGLVLEVVVENAIVADTDGAIRVGLRNDHEAPYYLPNIALDEDLVTLIDHFKTNGSVILEDPNMEELKTGETIWWDYLVPRENWDVLTQRSDEDFYLLDAIVESLGGTTELEHEIRQVMPFTINGDLIVVTRLSKSGAESEISYVNLAKSNAAGGTVPSLAIRTYRQNKQTHAYEPCSMEITIKDEHIIRQGVDAEGNNVGEDGITVTTDESGYYCYEGYTLTNLYNTKSYNIRISASRAKPVEIPVVMRGASAVTGLLTVYTYTGSGSEIQVLEGAEVTIMEADSTNATGTTDEDGKIVFKKVDQGYQELIITKDGYLPLRELVEVSEESEYSFRLYEDSDPNATRILQVSNSLSDYSKGNQTILPEGGITGTIQFVLKARMAEGETFECYHYRIVDKDGTVRKTETFKTDNGFWLDLTELKAGDTLEFAVKNTDGKISPYTDSNLLVFEQPGFFNGLVYDLSNIQLGGSIDTSGAFEFDPFATLETLYVTGIGEGVAVEDDENGFQAVALEYLSQYVFSNTRFTQSFPLTAKYDLSGKLTLSVVCGGSAKTTTTTGTAYGAGVAVATPTASYSSTVQIAQKTGTETERTMSGNIKLDFVFQYDAAKDDWSMTVYLDASASQNLFDKDVTLLKVAYVAGEAELKETVKLEVAQTHVGPEDTVEILGNGLVPDSFNAEGEVKGSVGATVVNKKLASVGLYAKGGVEFQFLPYWSLTAKTALGVEGNVLLWKKEKDLVSGVWEASGDTSVALLAETALYDLRSSEERLKLAENTRENGGWQGNQGEKQWLIDAYSNADLQLAPLSGDKILAVWCDYTHNADDPVALYWSVYHQGSWSLPARVDNDGTADLYPSLLATETGAQLVWVDFSGSVALMNNPTYYEIAEQAFAMLGVTTAAFTADGGWSSAVEVSGGALAAAPKAAAGEDGSILVSWITNAANLEEATQAQPDSIRWVRLDERGAVTDSGSLAVPYANLADLRLGYENGYRMSVLAEQDTGELKLHSAVLTDSGWSELSVVSTLSGEDTGLAMTADGVTYTINSGRLYAYKDGQLVHLMHSELLPADAGELTCTQTPWGTVLLWTGRVDGDSAVCMVLVDASGKAFQPLVVARTADGVLSAPAAAVSGSQLTVLFQHAYIQENTWCRDMEIRTVPMGVDLSLEDSLIQHSSHLVPGVTLESYVEVDSLGAIAPDSFAVEIYTAADGAEQVIAEETGSSGMNVTLQWMVPADYAGEPVYLRVVHADDCDPSNNTVRLDNLVRELAVSGATYVGILDGKDIFTVEVENQGLVTSEATSLQVRPVGSEEVLLEREIGEMNAGAKQTIRLELDALDRTKVQPLVFTLIPVKGEGDESNNKEYLILPVSEHICREGTAVFHWEADYSGAAVTYTCAQCGQVFTDPCKVTLAAEENRLVFTAQGPKRPDGGTLTDVQTIQLVQGEDGWNLQLSLTEGGAAVDLQLIVAAYEESGKMMEAQPVDAPTADVPVTVEGEVIRVFFLDRETQTARMPYLQLAK